MEANDKAFEKAKKNYITLMQIIDDYKDDEAATSKGLLYFLKGVVPELVVSKYGKRLGMEAFKEFFCNEVLQLNFGKRNYCEYENYFINGNTDGYRFETQYMNAYMDDESLREYGNPSLLLQRMWQVSHEKLYEYFRVTSEREKCASNYAISKSDRYCDFVMAVGLYEIFVMKFLGNSSFAGFSEKKDDLNTILDEILRLVERRGEVETELTEPETEAILRELDWAIEEMSRIQESMKVTRRAAEYHHHIKYLASFSMIIMLVEHHNVAEKLSCNRQEHISVLSRLQEVLHEEYDYLYMSEVKVNKGRIYTELYRDLIEAAEQNKIVQELCGSSEKVREQALRQIKDYCNSIKGKKYMDPVGNEAEDFANVAMQIALQCVEMKKQ